MIDRDVLPPFGILDTPKMDEKVTGTITLSGWAFDNTQVSRIDVLVDGTAVGTATYGKSRPDVASAYPYAAVATGFEFDLNTRRYANDLHEIVIQAADTAGNVASLPPVSIWIGNPPDPSPSTEFETQK
jgi:Big-like domain-containing protein